MITKELISFALSNEIIELDNIPMKEIVRVSVMNPEETTDGQAQSILQIDTALHGRNSGRSYYLRSTTEKPIVQLLEELRKLAAEARFRAEAATLMLRTQAKVNRFYNSYGFQTTVAFLIAAVSLFLHKLRIDRSIETIKIVSPPVYLYAGHLLSNP